jgi:hypothetical protein
MDFCAGGGASWTPSTDDFGKVQGNCGCAGVLDNRSVSGNIGREVCEDGAAWIREGVSSGEIVVQHGFSGDVTAD